MEQSIWRQLGTLQAQIVLRPKEKAQAKVQVKGIGERVFWSNCELPEGISEEVVALATNGKVLLDWERREFRLRPLGLGGGCCEAREGSGPRPKSLMELPPAIDHSVITPPEFLPIYETSTPSKPYSDLFSELLVDANYTSQFLHRNLTYLCSRTAFHPDRDHEAISFLRRVLYHTYFLNLKRPQQLTLKDSKSLSDLIKDYMVNVTDDIDRVGLNILIQGLDHLSRAPYIDDRMKTDLSTAYDIYRKGTTSSLIKLAIFDESFYKKSHFYSSTAVEINFYLVEKRLYADVMVMCVVLSLAIRDGDPFYMYLLHLIGDLFLSITTWNSAFSLLFEGNDEFRGLKGYLMNETNEPLSKECEKLYEKVMNSAVPELQELAVNTLKIKRKSPPLYLFYPFQGANAAIIADISVTPPVIRKVENEYFHSRSRIAFVGVSTAVITGVPINKGGRSSGCFELNLETLAMTKLPELLQARYWHTANCVNGLVIVAGGKIKKNEPATRSVEGWMQRKDAWSALDTLTHARDSHSSCVSSGVLYVFGGVADTDLATSIEKYQEGRWSVLPVKLPILVGLFAVGEIAEHTLLLAGGNNATRPLFCVSLDLETGIYSDLPELPEKSCFVSGMYRSVNHSLVVITQSFLLLKFEQGVWSSPGQFIES